MSRLGQLIPGYDKASAEAWIDYKICEWKNDDEGYLNSRTASGMEHYGRGKSCEVM